MTIKKTLQDQDFKQIESKASSSGATVQVIADFLKLPEETVLKSDAAMRYYRRGIASWKMDVYKAQYLAGVKDRNAKALKDLCDRISLYEKEHNQLSETEPKKIDKRTKKTKSVPVPYDFSAVMSK